jgi:hypothetical protein
MGNRKYRRNRDILLALSDVCGICHHGGAKTADHIISDVDWPRGPDGKRVPGFDELTNLQPAHGSMGNTGAVNRCEVCGLVCNQRKGSGSNRQIVQEPNRSRKW